jgi:hypothetical protein
MPPPNTFAADKAPALLGFDERLHLDAVIGGDAASACDLVRRPSA